MRALGTNNNMVSFALWAPLQINLLSNSQLSLRLSYAGLSLVTSDTQENVQCNICLVQVTVISLFYHKFGVLEGSCVWWKQQK